MSAWDNKKQETKPEEKTENKPTPAPSSELPPVVLRSEFDALISDHLKSEAKSLDEIDARIVVQPKEGINQLSLPEELKPYEKKYAFCWIFRHPKAIAEAKTLYHWSFVTRLLFQDVEKKAPYLFSANGIMERGDNILMFRSLAVDSEMRKAPGLESSQRIKNRLEAHRDDPAFYVPQSDEYEIDPKTGKRVKVPIVGV